MSTSFNITHLSSTLCPGQIWGGNMRKRAQNCCHYSIQVLLRSDLHVEVRDIGFVFHAYMQGANADLCLPHGLKSQCVRFSSIEW